LLPAIRVSVSLVVSATISLCPLTAIVPKLFGITPCVLVIVSVSPEIAVLIPVPPTMLRVSVTLFAVVLPLSLEIVANKF